MNINDQGISIIPFGFYPRTPEKHKQLQNIFFFYCKLPALTNCKVLPKSVMTKDSGNLSGYVPCIFAYIKYLPRKMESIPFTAGTCYVCIISWKLPSLSDSSREISTSHHLFLSQSSTYELVSIFSLSSLPIILVSFMNSFQLVFSLKCITQLLMGFGQA